MTVTGERREAETQDRAALEAAIKLAERRRWRPLILVAVAALLAFWPSTHVEEAAGSTIWRCPSTAWQNYYNPENATFIGFTPDIGPTHAQQVEELPDSTVLSGVASCRQVGQDARGGVLTALVLAGIWFGRRYWVLARAQRRLAARDSAAHAEALQRPLQ